MDRLELPGKVAPGGEFSFTAVNRHRYNKACQNRKRKPEAKQFEETYAFSLTSPLGLEGKSIAEARVPGL